MKQSSLRVVWSAPDGRETSIDSHAVRIDVADGLWIGVAFEMPHPTQITVDLSLHGASARRDGCGLGGSRFVVVPDVGSSVLVAVAEASDAPADLMPTASRPIWVGSDGVSMPTQQGSVAARSQDGTALVLSLAPGPGQMDDACILKVSLVRDDRQPRGPGSSFPVLSIPLLEQESLRIAAGRRQSVGNAT